MPQLASACLFVVGCLVVCTRALAQDDLAPLAGDKDALRGLPGIMVFVELANDAPLLENSVALGKESLRNHIVARLRVASLPVVTQSKHDGSASLVLHVQALQPNPKGFVWSIGLGLAQHVSLLRATDIKPVALTWFHDGLGSSGLATVRQDILSILDSLLDQLIAEYLEANQVPPSHHPAGPSLSEQPGT